MRSGVLDLSKTLSTWKNNSLLSSLYHWGIIIILLFIQACKFSTFGPLCHLVHAVFNLCDSFCVVFIRYYPLTWVDFYSGFYHVTIVSITDFFFHGSSQMQSYSADGSPKSSYKNYFLHVWEEGECKCAHMSIYIARSSYFLRKVTDCVLLPFSCCWCCWHCACKKLLWYLSWGTYTLWGWVKV